MEAAPLFATTSRLRAVLIAARERAARDLDTTPRRLLSDSALDAIIDARPTTELALRGVAGVSLRAAQALGPDVVALFTGTTVALSEPETPTDDTIPEMLGTPVDVTISVSQYLTTLNDALGAYTAIVVGEVTEVRSYPSGIYFTVKDSTGAEGVLNCYLAPYRVRLFGPLLTHGAEVRLAGTPRISPRKGGFSFVVEAVSAVGEGALRAAYEQLKRTLAEEGLFDRSLPLPLCVKRIGIVTSRSGAVIDDFRKNLEARGYQLLMHDARVEGVRAVPSLLTALQWFQAHEAAIDVLVVMRGGGSLEDLQAFNHESVARALAGFTVPVIAAIGHDRDVPIVSLVADHATSTPSIAALRCNQTWEQADQLLVRSGERLARGGQHIVAVLTRRTAIAAERLVGQSRMFTHTIGRRIADGQMVLQRHLVQYRGLPGEYQRALLEGFTGLTQRLAQRLLAIERELAIVDPQRTLQLGYSIVTDATGTTLRSVRAVRANDALRVRLMDGSLDVTTTHVHPETD